MGTGLREFGSSWGKNKAIDTTILVTHLHWDHVQGLPFFGPVHNPESKVAVYGPPHGNETLKESFMGLMRPPYFPICCDELPTGISFETCWDERFAIGDAKVVTKSVPHTGETNGYRIEINGYVIVYASDHQEPLDDPTYVADGVLELCDGADLIIHDSQFTREELLARPTWGHCTPQYAVEVAAQSGAKQVALFHHDPWHDDNQVDALLAECQEQAKDRGIEHVFAAAEGTTVTFR